MGAGYSIRSPVVKSRKDPGFEQQYADPYINIRAYSWKNKTKKTKKFGKAIREQELEAEEPAYLDLDAITIATCYEDVIPPFLFERPVITDYSLLPSIHQPSSAAATEVDGSSRNHDDESSISSNPYEDSIESGETTQASPPEEQHDEGGGQSLDFREYINETRAVAVSEGSIKNKHIDLTIRQDIQPTTAARGSMKYSSKIDPSVEGAIMSVPKAQANVIYANSPENELDLFGLHMDSKDGNLRRIADIAYTQAANHFEICVQDEIQHDNFRKIASKKNLEKTIDRAKLGSINVLRSLCVYPSSREAIIPYSIFIEHKLTGLVEGWRIILNANFAIDLEKREQQLLVEENKKLRLEIERLREKALADE